MKRDRRLLVTTLVSVGSVKSLGLECQIEDSLSLFVRQLVAILKKRMKRFLEPTQPAQFRIGLLVGP